MVTRERLEVLLLLTLWSLLPMLGSLIYTGRWLVLPLPTSIQVFGLYGRLNPGGERGKHLVQLPKWATLVSKHFILGYIDHSI